MRELTEQGTFWAGECGAQYLLRNTLSQLAEKTQRLWDRVLSQMSVPPNRILEFGCNIGINLVALSHLFPDAALLGIEINEKAAEEARYNLATTGRASVPLPFHSSMLQKAIMISCSPAECLST